MAKKVKREITMVEKVIYYLGAFLGNLYFISLVYSSLGWNSVFWKITVAISITEIILIFNKKSNEGN